MKKKLGANLQRIIELFTQKIFINLSKIWIWDPGSEIRNPEKTFPDPGSRTQNGTGSATLISRAQLEDIKSLNLEVSTRLAESQKSLLHKSDIIRKLETKVTHLVLERKNTNICLLQCTLQHDWLCTYVRCFTYI